MMKRVEALHILRDAYVNPLVYGESLVTAMRFCYLLTSTWRLARIWSQYNIHTVDTCAAWKSQFSKARILKMVSP